MSSILDAFYSLGKNLNKARGKSAEVETEQGVVSEKFPELKLDTDNIELLKLTSKWQKTWIESDVYKKWLIKIDYNEDYWKGKQHDQPKADKNRPLVDNVIF